MRISLVLIVCVMGSSAGAQRPELAPGGTLRAAYLAGNPAQVVKDAATGELRGVAIDLAGELARTERLALSLIGADSPQAVIDTVSAGKADIGFVAYNPERAGPVEFSQPYLLVNQTFVVREGSAIRSVADIDRPNQKIGATKGDSIALHLGRTLKQAQLVESSGSTAADITRMLTDGTLDAWGANRQRLTDAFQGTAGLRILTDDLYGVEQTIIVPKGRAEALTLVNQFIDNVRRSGFLQKAIDRSGVAGIAVANPVAR